MQKTLGQVAFDAYNNHGPRAGKTFDGRPIPPWEAGEPGGPHVEQVTKERWEASAEATRIAYLNGFGQDRADIERIFARANARFGELCIANNGPLSLRYLIEFFREELLNPSP